MNSHLCPQCHSPLAPPRVAPCSYPIYFACPKNPRSSAAAIQHWPQRSSFGGVPTERGFGAEVLDIGNRGKAWESHDDYYGDGSRSLGNLASIVSGNGPI